MKAKCFAFCADKLAEILDVRCRFCSSNASCEWASLEAFLDWYGPKVRPCRDTAGNRMWAADALNCYDWDPSSTHPRKMIRTPKSNGLWYGFVFEWSTPEDQLIEEMFIAQKGLEELV